MVYLRTGSPRFAMLKSEARPRNISPVVNAQSLVPASPKSVFALADLLGLEELKALCLPAITQGLDNSNAEAQLMSPASLAYDDVGVRSTFEFPMPY